MTSSVSPICSPQPQNNDPKNHESQSTSSIQTPENKLNFKEFVEEVIKREVAKSIKSINKEIKQLTDRVEKIESDDINNKAEKYATKAMDLVENSPINALSIAATGLNLQPTNVDISARLSLAMAKGYNKKKEYEQAFIAAQAGLKKEPNRVIENFLKIESHTASYHLKNYHQYFKSQHSLFPLSTSMEQFPFSPLNSVINKSSEFQEDPIPEELVICEESDTENKKDSPEIENSSIPVSKKRKVSHPNGK